MARPRFARSTSGFDESELAELRRRIEATRWPERETVADDSQGVPLATMQELARYWATEYDWRRCEARLNALPNVLTEIDGLDIKFIHVRSRHDHALPLIVTHGWPGSIVSVSRIAVISASSAWALGLPAFRVAPAAPGCFRRRHRGPRGSSSVALADQR